MAGADRSAGRRAGLPRAPLLIAAIAALPALAVPFLSDDWANMRSGAREILRRTPYGDFRPLSQATFAIDRLTWGAWPLPWHLANIVFVVAAAALLTALVQRHLRDRALAALAGVIFALHPYHIANVAWISARSAAIGATFLFAALVAYDRWRERLRGLPIAACLLFVAALWGHESSIVLPLVVVAIGWARDRRPPGRAEALRGILPLAAIAILHAAWSRTHGIGSAGLHAGAWLDADARQNLVRYATAGLLPAPVEQFSGGPSLLLGFGALGAVAIVAAVLLLMALATSARGRSGRIPPAALLAAGLFVLLALPSLHHFRADSLFIPGAASALLLAALLRAAGRRTAIGAGVLLAAAWGTASIDHWIGWRAASRASTALVGELTAASREPGVERIVVANLPRRVRGVPVGMEYTAAIEASGGRPVPVDYVTYLDYPRAFADDLDGPPDTAVRRTPEGVTIGLLVPEIALSGIVDPGPADPGFELRVRHGVIRFLEPNHMLLELPPATPGVARYVWQGGRLVPLDRAP